jgi:hypothetical protein
MSTTSDDDDHRLEVLGYKPTFRREFSNLATISFAFSIMVSSGRSDPNLISNLNHRDCVRVSQRLSTLRCYLEGLLPYVA